MSDVALTPLSRETTGVVSRLGRLRKQLAAWFWIDGLVRVLWLALALCAADLVLDWLFRMDRAQRGVMLAIMAGIVGWCVYRRLVRPLSVTMSDDALALQVEAAHKQLGQSMISALQLARIEDVESRGMSAALVRQTVLSGARAAERVDFGGVLDGREFRLNSVLLALALIAVAGLGIGIANNPTLRIWANRNLLLGEMTWPQQTYLVVERVTPEGTVVFPRGEDWTQVVRVREDSKKTPDAVYIEFRRAGGRPMQSMKKSGERTFEAVFNNVIQPFDFRARGGDAVTPWVRVELVEQPAIASLKLVVTPPRYTGLSAEELPPGRGPYYVLAGSSLRLEAASNKELVRAELVFDGEPLIQPRPSGGAKAERIRLAGREPLLAGRGTRLAAEIPPDRVVAGAYTFDLEDTLGLASRRPTTFGLRQRIDREPRVRVRLIGISSMVVPKARLPFTCRVTDDFGIVQAEARYSWKGDGLAQADGAGAIPFDKIKDQLGQAELAFDDALELAPLKTPTGINLNLQFAAADNDEVSGPNVGLSSAFLVRVVTEEELRTDLLRREKEQRQEFERLKKNQDELLTDCRALLAGTRGLPNLTPQQKDQLMQYQKRQKLVGQNTGAIAERLANIVIEVQNNRLEEAGGKLQTRLERDIIRPMQDVAGDLIPDAMNLLDRTRRQSAEVAPRDQALTDAVARQEQIAQRMQEILEHMVKSEGFQEAVNLLYEIQKAQSDVHEQTNKERQERIRRILEGAGTAPQPSSPAPKP